MTVTYYTLSDCRVRAAREMSGAHALADVWGEDTDSDGDETTLRTNELRRFRDVGYREGVLSDDAADDHGSSSGGTAEEELQATFDAAFAEGARREWLRGRARGILTAVLRHGQGRHAGQPNDETEQMLAKAKELSVRAASQRARLETAADSAALDDEWQVVIAFADGLLHASTAVSSASSVA